MFFGSIIEWYPNKGASCESVSHHFLKEEHVLVSVISSAYHTCDIAEIKPPLAGITKQIGYWEVLINI